MTGDPMRLGWLLYPPGVNPVLVLAARLANTATDGIVVDSTAKANSTRLYPRCLISTIRLNRLFPGIPYKCKSIYTSIDTHICI